MPVGAVRPSRDSPRETFPRHRLGATCRQSKPELHPCCFPLQLFNCVDQSAYAIDGDLNLIVALKRKGVRWNNACSREQKAAVRKAVIAEEILDQCRRIAFQFG